MPSIAYQQEIENTRELDRHESGVPGERSAPLWWFISLFAAAIAAAAVYVWFAPNPLTFMSILILLMLSPLAFLYPQQSFLVLLIVRSMVDITGEIPIISLGGLSLNLSATLGVLLIGWGLWYFIKFWPLPRFRGRFALILFLIAGIASVITSIDVVGSAQEYVKFINMVWVFVIAFHIVSHWQGYWKLVATLAASIIVPMIVALLQLISGSGLSFDISNRLLGTFGHPNTFALALVMAMGAWIILHTLWKYQSASCPPWLSKLFAHCPYRGIYSILLFFLALTYARGAWIGMSILLLLWGFRFARRQTLAMIIVGVTLIIFLPILQRELYSATGIDLAENQLIQRLSTREEDTTSWAWRVRSWQEMKAKLHSLPWFGYGVGKYTNVREETVSYLTDLKSREAHNDYLRLVVEIGYLGAASYTVFLIFIAGKFIYVSLLSNDAAMQRVGSIVGAMVIAFLIVSIADNVLRATAVNWLLWALMGGTLGLVYHVRNSPTANHKII